MAADGIFLAVPEEPSTRHPAGGQGPPRHRRADDDVRLGRLRRVRPRDECGVGATRRGSRLRERRQDEPARVRVRNHVGERALRHGPEPARTRAYRRRLVSGGSAAALAASLADAALGTDSGGSIRIPAACCGVVGFKPTYELVSTVGCFPLAPSFDHVGPMARTVEECVALLAGDRAWVHADDARARWRRSAWRPRGPTRRTRSSRNVFARQPATFREARSVDWPRPEIGALFMREVADVHRELYAENGELYGEEIAVKIERCLAVSDGEASGPSRREPSTASAAWSSSTGSTCLSLRRCSASRPRRASVTWPCASG